MAGMACPNNGVVITVVMVLLVFVACSVTDVADVEEVKEEWPSAMEAVTSYPCYHDDSFRCFPEVGEAESQECIPEKDKCDGVEDCSNGRDEMVEVCGCLPSEFKCNSSVCIDILLRCDRNHDCLDGRDEMNCGTYFCPVTHVKCDDHTCIPRDKECDFVDDCGDYSDERICSRRDCYSTEFRCNNAQCVSMAYLCDNITDCQDGSDEERGICEQHMKCPMGFYVDEKVICDGWIDCHFTNTDELNCGECKENQYRCPNSQCVYQANVCDGVCDCLSCADEDNCDTYACLPEEKYLCHAKEGVVGRCIGRDNVCDGDNNCFNTKGGLDEYFCTKDKNCSKFERKGDNYFYCPEGRCLPEVLKCDGITDCIDGYDEKGCDLPSCSGSEFTCSSGQCIHMDKRCDSTFDCYDRSDEADCGSYPCKPSQTRCHSGQCIDKEKWCDFFRNCLDGSDERGCEHRACDENEFRCSNGQCIDMKFECYNGKESAHLVCVDKSHLFNCSKFQCSEDRFKCREGYCLDRTQQCDRSVDCEYSSSDEKNCRFACPFKINLCLCEKESMNCEGRLLTKVPDIHQQEHITSLLFSGNLLKLDKDSFSPFSFDKITYLDLSNNSLTAVPEHAFGSMWRLTLLSLNHNNISSLGPKTFTGLASLKTLHLHGNSITSFHNETFLPLTNLRGLDLSGHRLTTIGPKVFKGLRRLMTLNLASNLITSLSSGAFRGLTDLISLNLSNNRLRKLEDSVFSGLNALEKLDLSSNEIHAVYVDVFRGLSQLRSLDLSSNRIQQLDDGVFLPMEKLEFLSTDHFKFCCLASEHVRCLPEPDEFSSCEDLMSNHMLRISIWVLGVVALLGNIVVILWRLRDFRGGRHRRQQSSEKRMSDPREKLDMTTKEMVHSFLITNLAIGDLLMGVYLLIIASVDLHYRGDYIIHDEEWRSSDLCRFAGFVSTFSSELSVLTLTTITLDRLLCILFPLKRTRLGLKQAIVVMILIWLFVFLIAIMPIFGMDYFEDFYGRSGVCLALHVTPDRPAGWEYSVAVFLVLNFLSFLVIAASYLWMFIVAKKTRNAVRTTESQNDTAMARRMTIIVMTDFCCWVPIILLGFVSLAGARTDNQVYAWIAVFVLPLNSATNPILYTLSTAPFLGNVRKRVTVFRKSFINSITADTKHSYVEDRTTNYYYDRKSPYRQLELIRLRSLNNSSAIACYSRDNFTDT